MNDKENRLAFEAAFNSVDSNTDDGYGCHNWQATCWEIWKHAIAAMKAKSDAGQILEWVSAAGQFNPRRVSYSNTLKKWLAGDATSITAEAPTLATLAEKIGEVE